MRKNILINIGLSAGSIIGFFLVIEFGLRITGLQTVAPNPPKIYQRSSNPEINYELKPNLKHEKAYKARVSTNSLGLRSPEPDGTPVMAILGDSVTFGYGVNDDETLSARLQERVTTVQYQSAAVPGYALTQEAATYRKKLLPLKPESVILVFYWNDLEGTVPGILDDQGVLRDAAWTPGQETCQPIEEGIMGFIPGKCWLDTHSAFYKACKKLINLKQSKGKHEEEREQLPEQSPDREAKKNIPAYEESLSALSKIHPEQRYFVIWPDNFWHPALREDLVKIAENNGFEVIDLYAVFGNNVPTLPWDTVHPSPESIERAAAAIAERFRLAE